MRMATRVCLSKEDEEVFLEVGKFIVHRAQTVEELNVAMGILKGDPLHSLKDLKHLNADQTHWHRAADWVAWFSRENHIS